MSKRQEIFALLIRRLAEAANDQMNLHGMKFPAEEGKNTIIAHYRPVTSEQTPHKHKVHIWMESECTQQSRTGCPVSVCIPPVCPMHSSTFVEVDGQNNSDERAVSGDMS